jgi:hypothetical protein
VLKIIRAALVVPVVLAAACSSTADLATSSSLPMSTTGVTASTVQPIEDVSVGMPCDAAGRIGLTSDGSQLLCSASTASGEALDSPVWREAAGRDLVEDSSLTPSELDAIAAAREIDPMLESEADHALVIMISEYAATMELAADSGVSVDEAFYRLVDGAVAQNGFSLERGVAMTQAMVAASTFFLPEDNPGHRYVVEMITWMDSLADE